MRAFRTAPRGASSTRVPSPRICPKKPPAGSFSLSQKGSILCSRTSVTSFIILSAQSKLIFIIFRSKISATAQSPLFCNTVKLAIFSQFPIPHPSPFHLLHNSCFPPFHLFRFTLSLYPSLHLLRFALSISPSPLLPSTYSPYCRILQPMVKGYGCFPEGPGALKPLN